MGDVAEPAAWEAMVGTALDNYGKVTTLVHNAADTDVDRRSTSHWRSGMRD